MSELVSVFNKTVVIGMSGGVDSSLSAALLKEAGAKVIALFMKNWEEDDPNCPAAADINDVALVCDKLEIPFYTVNFSKAYWDEVFATCLEGFKRGVTPNPDILCNSKIKFDLFFKKALELGADFLATGHYCQIGEHAGQKVLCRGADANKDQSYFLYTLKSRLLEKVLFPIGHLCKTKVREMAKERRLVTADKKDSTGICFIGKRNFKPFLSQYIAPKKGPFETPEGQKVGEHDGMAYYTIGQRRGLAIGGAGEAWYVADKDASRNAVIVVQGEDHPKLLHKQLTAYQCSWVGAKPLFPLRCSAKIRYRQVDAPCSVTAHGEEVVVTFDEPQKAITPGQSVVFYQGPICLGGGLIASRS